MKQVIIIPDIHGRTFWKAPIEKYKNDPDTHIVFMGDYLDTYSFEHISDSDAINNFVEIIDEAINSNNIILLIGNHDLHYYPMFLKDCGCRRINDRLEEISDIFVQNKNLFKIAWETYINGKQYLFTHAGVTPSWLDKITNKPIKNHPLTPEKGWIDLIDLNEINHDEWNNLKCDANSLNWIMKKSIGQIALSIVGKSRGGRDYTGSCLWADMWDHIDEMQFNPTFYKERYQIFSHTLSYPSYDDPYICEEFAMLDARKAFKLDCETGKITEL